MKRLSEEPKVQFRNVRQLLGLATAMEETAAQRYQGLAARMVKLNEREIAGTFSTLVEEQRDHVEEIAGRSRQLTGAQPPTPADPRGLPSEIARSWNEAEASALLTPYRALGIAVDNEMLAFAYYSYVAAQSDDTAVRATAEWLAGKALDHAATL
ncbi:MAG: rubrerythrin family protein, partial [Mesorhizobium sp.]